MGNWNHRQWSHRQGGRCVFIAGPPPVAMTANTAKAWQPQDGKLWHGNRTAMSTRQTQLQNGVSKHNTWWRQQHTKEHILFDSTGINAPTTPPPPKKQKQWNKEQQERISTEVKSPGLGMEGWLERDPQEGYRLCSKLEWQVAMWVFADYHVLFVHLCFVHFSTFMYIS